MTETELIYPAIAESVGESVAAPDEPLADLILVRLLPDTKLRLTPLTIRNDVSRLFPRPPSADEFSATLSNLRNAGLIATKGQVLTNAGRSRAVAYLGVDRLPSGCNWRAIKAKYLVPKALGLEPAKTLPKEKLAALLLKRKYSLPVGTANSLNATFEALACQRLGFSDCVELKDVKTRILARELNDREKRSFKELAASAPAALLETPRPGLDGLHAIALAGLFAPSGTIATQVVPAIEPASDDFDLEAFANTVLAAARDCPTGRHGDDKVWISHVWRQLYDQPPFHRLGLDGFKTRLAEANQRRLLTLSRADLGPMLDSTNLRESELHHAGGIFHFVLIRGA